MTEFAANFHFLRPEWLFALLLIPLLAVLKKRKAQANDSWDQLIPKHLLVHLRTNEDPPSAGRTSSLFGLALMLAMALSILAMAGPAWQQKPKPVAQASDDLVVIFDLSVSMLATDLSPNRLTRAKQKLQDLLALRKEGSTGLIVFSGDSHIVTPLSDDTNTLLANLPALDPFMMPVIGSRPDRAVEQALSLLDQAKARNGRIVMLTDSVEPHHAERIQTSLTDSGVSLSVIAIGTAAGGPIDLGERGYLKSDGSVVIPKTDYLSLRSLADQNNGRFAELALSDSDLISLDISGEERIALLEEQALLTNNEHFDDWEDAGFWLLLIIVPLVLVAYRQNVLLGLAVLVCVFPSERALADRLAEASQATTEQSKQGSDFRWMDLWQSRDQQAQSAMDKGHYEEAAQLFESENHAANARYLANSQAQSEAQSKSKQHFNEGNQLARNKQFEAALEKYNQALAADPDNQDAQANKTLIENYLNQQKQKQSGESGEDQKSGQQGDNQQNGPEQEKGTNESSSDQNQHSNDKQANQEQSQNSDQNQQQDQANQQSQDSQQSQDVQQSENTSQSQEKQQANSQQANSQQDAQQSEDQPESKSKPGRLDNTQEPNPDGENEQTGTALQEVDELSDEERQSFEQWMRRVPDDPSGLLRRKFEQQAQERNRQRQEPGEPLW